MDCYHNFYRASLFNYYYILIETANNVSSQIKPDKKVSTIKSFSTRKHQRKWPACD